MVLNKSTRRDSNPRPSPWQGDTPPLSHSCINNWYSVESGWWESNPRIQLGRLVFYHWTTPASVCRWQHNVLYINQSRLSRTFLTFFEKFFVPGIGWTDNAQNRNRTSDTRIFSPLLYQLSYLGIDYKSLSCGSRIWTCDLRVMSPTSFQTAPSRDIKLISQKRKADDRTRTDNLLITNQLLCQLSHIGL